MFDFDFSSRLFQALNIACSLYAPCKSHDPYPHTEVEKTTAEAGPDIHHACSPAGIATRVACRLAECSLLWVVATMYYTISFHGMFNGSTHTGFRHSHNATVVNYESISFYGYAPGSWDSRIAKSRFA